MLLWKRERVASNAVGYGTSGFSALFFVFGAFDPNFRLIVTKPDNVPIVGLIFLLVFFVWYSIREGGAERPADRGRARRRSRRTNRTASGCGPTWSTPS